mgnify:CR=1 FL=1
MVKGTPKGKKNKDVQKNFDLAYTPLTEAQKKLKMEQLIKDLHSGKRGGYKSPGGTRTNISDRH